MVRLNRRLQHQIIITGAFITKSHQKNHIYLVDNILGQIPDLEIYPKGTMIWFAPLILEKDLGFMDGPYTNTAGKMILFWRIFFTIHCAIPLPGFL